MRTYRPLLILFALLLALLPAHAPAAAQGPEPEAPQQPNVIPPDGPAPPAPLAGPALAGAGALSEPLDIVLVQDETSSMWDDIGALRALAPQIWDSLAERSGAGFRMSVVGFRDYARGFWGGPGDHVYRRVQDFTTDRAAFVGATGSLMAWGGYDTPEGQYAALAYLLDPLAGCIDSDGDGACTGPADTPARQQPDVRPGARLIVLLATDAPFHDPGDTRGYPGPGRAQVLELLRTSRATVIGLVPGGAGRLAEVDDLAAATGGSTQPTGASGQQVAAAIVAALDDLLPVSPALSTVAVSSPEAPADGATPVTVTVTLRDTLGRPVAGKDVRLSSDRGPADAVEQPALPTDAAGRTTGVVRSSAGGAATITAIDLSDGVWVEGSAVITFRPPTVPPGDELLAAIGRIDGEARAQIEATTAIAQSAAEHARYFKGAVESEGAAIVTTAVFGLLGAYGSLKHSADLARQAGQIAYPAYGGATWREITSFSARHPEASLFYEAALSKGLFQGSWDAMSLTVLRGGLMYSTSAWAEEAGEEIAEETVAQSIDAMLKARGGAPDGYAKHVERFAADAAQLRGDLAERRARLEAGVPALSQAEQAAYARDLDARAPVPGVYNRMARHDMELLENLRVAREASQRDAWQWLALKLLGGAGAALAFDGTGLLLFNGVTTSLDLYWKTERLGAYDQAHGVAQSVALKRAPEIATAAHSNVAGAYSRLAQGLPVDTPAVAVTGIHQQSEGYTLLPSISDIWVETGSFTRVSLANAGPGEATVEVVGQYFHESQRFGTLWDVVPVTNYEVVTLAPGARAEVVLRHHDGGAGAAPIGGRDMTIAVLATNGTGQFLVEHRALPWRPSEGALAGLAASADAPRLVIERPFDVYLSADPASQVYTAQVWVTNPFTGTIRARLRQPLPEGATVVAGDGRLEGGAMVWEQPLEPSDVRSGAVSFRLPAGAPAELRLAPAVLSFAEPERGLPVTMEGDGPAVTMPAPVRVAGQMPAPAFRAAPTVPLTVTNLSAAPQAGELELTLWAGEAPAHAQTIAVELPAGGAATVAATLPATLRPGRYLIEVRARFGATDTLVLRDELRVAGVAVYLPGVRR